MHLSCSKSHRFILCLLLIPIPSNYAGCSPCPSSASVYQFPPALAGRLCPGGRGGVLQAVAPTSVSRNDHCERGRGIQSRKIQISIHYFRGLVCKGTQKGLSTLHTLTRSNSCFHLTMPSQSCCLFYAWKWLYGEVPQHSEDCFNPLSTEVLVVNHQAILVVEGHCHQCNPLQFVLHVTVVIHPPTHLIPIPEKIYI